MNSNTQTEVTKFVEFDAGHRIPNHKSKCRNFHGHRYRVEATLRGPVKSVRGESDDGMVLDFSDIKRILVESVHDVYDHAFIIYEGDESGRDALKILGPDHRTVIVSFVPTAENLAKNIFASLDQCFSAVFGDQLVLSRVRVYETPTSWADEVRV